MPCAKGPIEFNHFLSIRHVHGDLCKHFGIDLSIDPEGLISFKLPTFIEEIEF